MKQWQQRTATLLGETALERLAQARVAVLGLGGVGGSAAEALVRAGVGHLLVVDKDVFDLTNLNRQLLATLPQVGRPKVDVAKERFLSINPQLHFEGVQTFYLPENSVFLMNFCPDYVIDAIDTVTAKLFLAQDCTAAGVPLITCLGTGNRLDPSKLRIGPLEGTVGCGCALARVMRHELKKRGVQGLQVLYSTEEASKVVLEDTEKTGRHSPGSTPFVPPVAGYLLASHVVRSLLGTTL